MTGENKGPKYHQIKNAILRDIRERGLQPGEQVPSISEIMERFNVSRITAVRSLTELENEGVVRREHGRGTFVAITNQAGDGQAVRKTVAMIVPNMKNPFYVEVVGSAERRLRAEGIAVELSTTDYQKELVETALDLVISENRVAGMILVSLTTAANLDKNPPQLPFVLVDNCPPELLGRCVSIGCDHVKGGMEAAAHLAKLGHRRIGYISMPYGTRQRLAGFRKGLEERGIRLGEDQLLTLKSTRIEGDEVVEFVNRMELTAIFAFNDMIAMQVMQVLRNNDFRVPEDISVLGYDDIEAARYLEVSLTTIQQHEKEVGLKAAEILLESLREGEGVLPRPREIVYIPRLVVRASTAPPPSDLE